MSEVSYSNVPPMMAAIRGGDIETTSFPASCGAFSQ